MAGAEIAGVPGALLSVPILAIVRIVYRQLKVSAFAPIGIRNIAP
jgi:predicted PurR-regulated permease PerM